MQAYPFMRIVQRLSVTQTNASEECISVADSEGICFSHNWDWR